jgi:hypothetical protein
MSPAARAAWLENTTPPFFRTLRAAARGAPTMRLAQHAEYAPPPPDLSAAIRANRNTAVARTLVVATARDQSGVPPAFTNDEINAYIKKERTR